MYLDVYIDPFPAHRQVSAPYRRLVSLEGVVLLIFCFSLLHAVYVHGWDPPRWRVVGKSKAYVKGMQRTQCERGLLRGTVSTPSLTVYRMYGLDVGAVMV